MSFLLFVAIASTRQDDFTGSCEYMLYMFFSSSDVTDFQKFEANLEVKGFLKEPQQFQWSSFPNSILVEQDTVKPEINLQPPIPAIPLKEILGPW